MGEFSSSPEALVGECSEMSHQVTPERSKALRTPKLLETHRSQGSQSQPCRIPENLRDELSLEQVL